MKDTNVYMVSKLLQPIIHQIADQGYNEYKGYTYVVQERAMIQAIIFARMMHRESSEFLFRVYVVG